MSVAAAAIAGGAALAGTAWSALSGKSAQKRQIAWEKERAQNAHQWEVADLKAAGLNPILSAGGQGATTGGVSAPIPDTSQLTSGISSAIGLYQDNKRIENETQQTASNIDLQKSQETLNFSKSLTEAEQQGLLTKQQANTAMQTQIAEQQRNKIMQEIRIAEDKLELEKASMRAQIQNLEKDGKKKEAEALAQELRNKDYAFYKYKDLVLEGIHAINETRSAWGTHKNETHQTGKVEHTKENKKKTYNKKGEQIGTAVDIAKIVSHFI